MVSMTLGTISYGICSQSPGCNSHRFGSFGTRYGGNTQGALDVKGEMILREYGNFKLDDSRLFMED